VQYQYSLKIPKNHKMMNMNGKRVINHLKKYVVEKEMKQLMKADWLLSCKT